jgi:hypothetical protein
MLKQKHRKVDKIRGSSLKNCGRSSGGFINFEKPPTPQNTGKNNISWVANLEFH